MALFLDALTFSATASEVVGPGALAPIRLNPFQVLLWVSITAQDVEQVSPGQPRLPALLDCGHNHTLFLNEGHLRQTGLPSPLPWSEDPLKMQDASGTTRPVRRLLADVWLHSNIPSLADQPYRLRLGGRGAAVFPDAGVVKGPRPPLLGLAALCVGVLDLEMRCRPAGGTLNILVPETS